MRFNKSFTRFFQKIAGVDRVHGFNLLKLMYKLLLWEHNNNAKQIELKKELLSTWKKEMKKQKRQQKEQKKI